MPAESIKQTPGFYGKMPSHGDFVKIHLPRSFIDPWNTWLQASLHQTKTTLGDDWIDAYLTSPIYRFILSPGICGNHQWMGVMMPSMDSIGRYFPSTLCVPLPEWENSLNVLEHRTEWFHEAEALIMTCLEDSFDYDEFVAAVEGLGIISDHQTMLEIMDLPAAINGEQILISQKIGTPDKISQYFPEILKEALGQSCFAYSIWSTKGSDDIAASLIISEGLPLSRNFSSFFTGNWKETAENNFGS